MKDRAIIFSDGASRGNPGRGGWGSILVENEFVRELGGHESNSTNNNMEMRALLEALRMMKSESVLVFTDSSYLINGMTKWIFNWKKNDWKTKQNTEVLNRDLWEELYRLSEGRKVEYQHVKGHSGIPGNERVDEIATIFADKKEIKLFEGEIEDYRIDILNTKVDPEKANQKNRSKMKAYSYMSLIGGKVQRYKTWAECEAAIKGKANVKFRKSVSQIDEELILKEWGV